MAPLQVKPLAGRLCPRAKAEGKAWVYQRGTFQREPSFPEPPARWGGWWWGPPCMCPSDPLPWAGRGGLQGKPTSLKRDLRAKAGSLGESEAIRQAVGTGSDREGKSPHSPLPKWPSTEVRPPSRSPSGPW